jgi:quinolinate synthase
MGVRDPQRRVQERKRALGEELLILAHHYQRDEIVELADFSGDSLELARKAAQAVARHVVFCGVHFMAESADILRQPHQTVSLPHREAGCPLAEMATGAQMEEAYRCLTSPGGARPVVPVTYINSSAEAKAFCGRVGGTVCTSSNAKVAMAWALDGGRRALFGPDRNLGLNTARALGIPREEIAVWDPGAPAGGLSEELLTRATLVVWSGFCHVHTFFTPEHVRRARQEHRGCRVAVHPECVPEVVGRADFAGSTGAIVQYVSERGPGSVTVVGTEKHLVRRLTRTHPDRRVVPLAPSECPDMARTTLWCLAKALEEPLGANAVRVEESVAGDARIALERMLVIGTETS